MRFKSEKIGGYQIFAVTGTNTVSFAIDFDSADTAHLLGFAIERIDLEENERYFLYGFKVFEEIVPIPDETTLVTTFNHPVQSFVHDDFTAKPGRAYEYLFYPLKGKPKNIDRTEPPIPIAVRTELLFSKLEHDVFFNRGVASSQAYKREFGNRRPDDLEEPKRQQALDWLSRDLDEALLKFIGQAKRGDTLLCCFYEFRYEPVAVALKKAIDDQVKVRIIIDAKKNEIRDKITGEIIKQSFPRTENLELVQRQGFPDDAIILREAQPSNIQHNKFMVWLEGNGDDAKPNAVWTGSTNLSIGGIHGQTNVGHWLRNPDIATAFRDYWRLLAYDPGSKGKDDPDSARKTAELRRSVGGINKTPATISDIPLGVTPVFSPRAGTGMLELYAQLLDSAERLACITLAFGISKVFKERLADNSVSSHLAFFLLEKEDRPNSSSTTPFVALNSRNNVYEAWGSFLREPLHRWAKETSAGRLGLNQHVSFIHSKFLLRDPLSADPIVVTGSANFSEPSTTSNDENMLIIRGDLRTADIYFTEFNRLFFHYYFRSVQEVMSRHPGRGDTSKTGFSAFLTPDDSWLKKYTVGSLRRKRVEVFAHMAGFEKTE
ncbi:phospholipase D-like domain-containing protein [Phyllobacterium chamaecytisi]|uniref:phospholipase D-like domain-containing protein n=1 Tax=Phyllobacterium chamaecytisi TaxID=2876082 RepID=UPI001CC9A50A|nr:phospholipase D-like domain-containing protein [Phyllobacterium sp. KW56]MBZ9603107.1 phospholipase D-like domain-containing protein [Phyllobacterium sp. KW56]